MDIISPMLDVMFKRMFSKTGSTPILRSFLETYIDFKGKDLSTATLTDKEIKRYPDDKGSILDLRVEAGGAEIDIEVQLMKIEGDRNRFNLYLAKMFSDQATEKMKYEKMHNCKSLLILDYTMPEYDNSGEFCHSFKMRDDKGVIFSDALEINVVEIPRIRNLAIERGMDDRIMWAKLFAAKSEEELNMVQNMTNNPAIQQAVLAIKDLSADEQMRYEATARMKALLDEQARMETAEHRGEAKGKAKGEANIIAKMRASGMSEDQINSILSINSEQPSEDEDDESDGEDFEP